ncbi:unnamed protein product [Microthlaspi erraticum]|uniref:Uncharacterized protein n=1 Tax=Microthlaspi erraticum TaxID=1685480 RepID=A0A6D2JJ81_9BRAS|nr:unnamed protein product [Microthlaspi erraticum]
MMAEILRNQGKKWRDKEKLIESNLQHSRLLWRFDSKLARRSKLCWNRWLAWEEAWNDEHDVFTNQESPNEKRMLWRKELSTISSQEKNGAKEKSGNQSKERAVAAITLRNGKGYEPPASSSREAMPPVKKKPMEYVIIGDGTEPPKEVHVRIEPGTQEEVEKPLKNQECMSQRSHTKCSFSTQEGEGASKTQGSC